jgi:hypothetical protein
VLQAIKSFKREIRMAWDNSKDALTWNVFRYLENTHQLSACLSDLCGIRVSVSELIYWSYSQKSNNIWNKLAEARAEFGEVPRRSSEPDLIVVSDKAIFWIEAKLTSSNNTVPTHPLDTKKYLSGGNHWYKQVFLTDYDSLACKQKKYELLRLWLLGSYVAAQSSKNFYLVNLVCAEKQRDIEQSFRPHIKLNDQRHFLRWSWEAIFRYISDNSPASREREDFREYFRGKTIGYTGRGKLQLAFPTIR